MAIRQEETITSSVTSLVHKCGSLLSVVMKSGGAISYQDGNEHTITVCPYCLQEIEWGDLRNPEIRLDKEIH
jgi:hypothetical protein